MRGEKRMRLHRHDGEGGTECTSKAVKILWLWIRRSAAPESKYWLAGRYFRVADWLGDQRLGKGRKERKAGTRPRDWAMPEKKNFLKNDTDLDSTDVRTSIHARRPTLTRNSPRTHCSRWYPSSSICCFILNIWSRITNVPFYSIIYFLPSVSHYLSYSFQLWHSNIDHIHSQYCHRPYSRSSSLLTKEFVPNSAKTWTHKLKKRRRWRRELETGTKAEKEPRLQKIACIPIYCHSHIKLKPSSFSYCPRFDRAHVQFTSRRVNS